MEMVHIGTRDGTVTQLDCYTVGHTMGLERSRTQNGTGTPLNWCTINGMVVSTTIRWRPLPQFDFAFYYNSMAVSTTIRWLSLPQLDGGLYHNWMAVSTTIRELQLQVIVAVRANRKFAAANVCFAATKVHCRNHRQ